MYVQIGGDVVLLSHDIIAIIDYNQQKVSRELNDWIRCAEQNGNLVWITEQTAKSLVLTSTKLYASPISSLTLQRRVNQAVW